MSKKLLNLLPRIILLLVVAVSIFFGILGFGIIRFAKAVKPQKSDCIIVLGCRVYGKNPSPFLVARTDEGLRLYKKGYADKIIVSGGQGKGEDVSEAIAMKNYLISKDVLEKDIIVEDKSISTKENLVNSSFIMEKHKYKSCIVVSNSFHLKRAYNISKDLKLTSSFSGVYLPQDRYFEVKGFLREILALTKYYITK